MQILQSREKDSKVKSFLFKTLPYVPVSLPTLLFCRISELTIFLEGNEPIEHATWEDMVLERSELMNISNDIKIIGKLLLLIFKVM